MILKSNLKFICIYIILSMLYACSLAHKTTPVNNETPPIKSSFNNTLSETITIAVSGDWDDNWG